LHYPGGLKTANALSEHLLVEVYRCDKLWRQEYRRGNAVTALKAVEDSDQRGTQITFWPDPEIFQGDRNFHFDSLKQRLRELAFLNKTLTVKLNDHRDKRSKEETYHYPDGIIDCLRSISEGQQPVHHQIIYGHAVEETGEAEVAMQWHSGRETCITCYANSHHTPLGGAHREGLVRSVGRTLTAIARTVGLLAERSAPISLKAWQPGLSAVVAVNIREPQFESQAKVRLNNPEASALVCRCVRRGLTALTRLHSDDADAMFSKVLAARDARLSQVSL
jgi:DNA gyrase subunit B